MPPKGRGEKNPNENLTIFGAGANNVIPGEVIIQLRPDTTAALSVGVPTGPSRGLPGIATNFGVSELDAVLADIGTTSVTAVHAPAPPRAERGFAVAADITPMNSTFKVRFDPGQTVDAVVSRLTSVGEVEVAEPNRYREAYIVPNDPSYPQQWGLAKLNCPAAWDRTTGSANVTVAVVDSGVDLNHPQLAPLLLAGNDLVDWGPNPSPPGLAPLVLEGDFAGRDNNPQDEVGHGTHVAGTISCLSNDGIEVAGVTWQCRLLPVRVLARARNTTNGRITGIGSSADIAAGITWAADHGAQVINLSLGGSGDTMVERNAVAYAVSRGVVVVAAMGNDGTNNPSYPAAYPDVIAVGAVNAVDQRATFSQTGPHIDVAAPGVNVLSTYWDDTYAFLDGTSMASPHVAGVAALILSCNSTIPALQVGQIIRDTARPLRDDPADPVPNDRYGSGLVDARAALDRACPPRPSEVIVRCPSLQFPCRSLQIICVPSQVPCPSVQIICPSQVTICAPSRVVHCPSVLVRCPSVQFCPTGEVCPSTQVCPSLGVCPSGPVCGQPGQPGQPGQQGQQFGGGRGITDYGTYDPYAYDPYAIDYNE
jgi:subtilisin family serine protease